MVAHIWNLPTITVILVTEFANTWSKVCCTHKWHKNEGFKCLASAATNLHIYKESPCVT